MNKDKFRLGIKIASMALIILPFFLVSPVFGEDLRVLESQLNNNSITGIIQNPYDFTIGGITVRAEFYDKEDGHLVGLRDFGSVKEDELEPNEKTSYKIYEEAGETGEFPKTDFVVKAEGDDWRNAEPIDIEEYAKNVTRALKSIPTEIVTTITVYENGSRVLSNVTEVPRNNTD